MKNSDNRTESFPSFFSSFIWLNLVFLMLLSILMAGCNQAEVAETETIAVEAAEPAVEEVAVTADEARLEVESAENLGEYLTDGSGRSLYIFLADSPMESTCYDACAEAWPPFTSEGMPAAGPEVDVSKVGTIERNDGTTQVTYAGWPLYYYVKDQGSGQRTGQDIKDHGAEWYLISPEGNKVEGEGH
ncbi:putative lipoprotein with Yx(FWY)xxD motif [Pontibacter ummariensis]|uniref:Predicted lipoprotein with conserved Yx(FWY)xxD motif n=1 Tax=Pontibacter ummariensis TaxID=1610492 RepID=A0A239FM74_9BACT|nr:hypothetical protein [Pontibacter ummariensis]PRY12006.1 putative lipoprotein with Yx(FWY)xxD motif [Pontibacter ummariensis]SNS58056.1 Predicted lipoprotein with conserved Yx(FWY)xxD motif [Pontibacter ummariensis]